MECDVFTLRGTTRAASDRRRAPTAQPLGPVVYVVDDDVSVRESVEVLIALEGWRCQAFASAQDFLLQPPVELPCCLVLDLNLPGLNGLELQQIVSHDRAHMPIIFISGYGDVPSSVSAMKAGAAEFLVKPFETAVLLESIRTALDKSRAALADLGELQRLRDAYATLSAREREVMALVSAGLMNKQVGGELGISEITVKAHRGQVMRKMNARSFADLVKMNARLTLADTPEA